MRVEIGGGVDDFGSAVFAQDAEDAALNGDLRGGYVDGIHFSVGGLEANNIIGLIEEALEGGFCAMDQGDDDFSLTSGAGALDEDVVAVDDVLIAHGISADFKGEDIAVSDDIVERDGLRGFRGLNWQASGDATGERQACAGTGAGAGREQIDGATAIVHAVEQPFFLEVGDVLVDGGKALEAYAASNLLEGRGVAVALHE